MHREGQEPISTIEDLIRTHETPAPSTASALQEALRKLADVRHQRDEAQAKRVALVASRDEWRDAAQEARRELAAIKAAPKVVESPPRRVDDSGALVAGLREIRDLAISLEGVRGTGDPFRGLARIAAKAAELLVDLPPTS